MTLRPECDNCASTGWVSYLVPGSMVDGVLQMRERIAPCHLCNAGGSWSGWAQEVIDHSNGVSEDGK